VKHRHPDTPFQKLTWADLLVRFVVVPAVVAFGIYGLVMYASAGAGGHQHHPPGHAIGRTP